MKKDYIMMLFLKSIEPFRSKFLYALCISVFLIGTTQIYAETESSIITDGDPIPGQATCTTCITVNSSTDDAEGWEDGYTFLESTDLELVHDDDYGDTGHRGNQMVGIRFNTVNVPQGATISNAYIQFTADEIISETEQSNGGINVDPCNLTIFGQADDNPGAFTNSINNVSDRSKTVANVAWNPPLWETPGAQTSDQQTVDISAIIQEIVNRTGYSINNSMVILITGIGRRTVASFDGSPSQAPQLCIEYSADDCDNVPDPPNDGCDSNTDIGGTTGFISLSDADNGSYPLVDTVVTYEFEEVGGENLEAIDLNGPGEQGPVFKFTEGDLGSSGSVNATFSTPIIGAKFKLTDFDFDEIATVNAYDKNNVLIDLTSSPHVTVGSQISQSGNVFTTLSSAKNVDGDLIASDPDGSIIFDFYEVSISRIDVTVVHPSASSIRYTQIEYCDVDIPSVPECVFEDLLSYTLIAEKRIGLNYNSTVCDGGVGITDNYGTVGVRYNSHVEDFVKSPNIRVNYSSSVGSKIYDNVDLPLPEFVHNTVSDGDSQDIVVNYGETITLDGFNYGRIEVQRGATVIFTKSNVFIDELITRFKGKVEFTQNVNLFIKKSVVFGIKTRFNQASDFSVVMYVEEDVYVRKGSEVDSYIYALNNIVVKGRRYNRTMMNGLFIGKRIRGVSYVSWCTGATCSTAEIVIPNSDTSVAARGGNVNKGTDAIAIQIDNSEFSVDFGAKTWPNPSSNDFNIRITTDNTLDKVNIQVMDITGKQVHLNTFTSDQSYKFGSNLQSGVYIVKISQAENNKTLRVVKY